MIIPINDKYRLKSDEYQWIIERKRTRKGEEDWQARLFYPTVKAALQEPGRTHGQSKLLPKNKTVSVRAEQQLLRCLWSEICLVRMTKENNQNLVEFNYLF